MSSFNYRISRKRSLSPSYRDNSDSEDDSPPKKLKSQVFGANASVAITSQLKKLAVWCATLPVKGYFQMAFKAGANLRHEEIVVDDDDDDDVIAIKEEEKHDAYLKKLEQVHRQLRNKQRQRRELERNGPHQQRYPTRGSEITCDFDSRFDLPHTKTNGSSSVNWRTRSNANGHNLRMLHIDSSLAPVSNPSTDVEILLDSESKKSADPESEIEIISESGNMKPKPALSQRPIRRLISKSVSSNPSLSSSTHNRAHSSKHYTADEVNRLHEKEQYKLLLDKYIDGTQYHSVSKKRSTSADDLLSLEITGAPFKKEVLNQPITSSFIDKYRKPIQLVNTENSIKSQEPEVVTIDDDDDDECEFHYLPKFRPRYKSGVDSFSSDFINELRNNVQVQTKERLKLVEKYEKCIEDIRQKRLLQALKYDKNAEAGEPELPALTPAMENDIDVALHGDPEECVSNLNGSKVFRKDIETLDGLNWLNDLIINTYLDLIVERSKSEGFPSVYAYNTFFYTSFKTKGYAAVRRWTRKVDIFSYDLNFIPLHLGLHWALGVIDHRSKKISYYDSMGDSESKCLDILYEYISMEHRDKKSTELDVPYTADIMKGIPQQMNGSDCGMFTLKYAEYISRDAEITFSQKDMAYFRRRMIYELLCGKILC